MRYSDQLKDPRWQKKRLLIFQRDRWRCQRCGNDKEQLHAHHPKYRNGLMAWEYDDLEIQTLCASCHHEEHFPTKPAATAPKRATFKIRGYAVPWACFKEEGFPPLHPIPWSGEKTDYPNSERNGELICCDLKGNEWLVDMGCARGFLFPPCGHSTKEWLDEIIRKTEEGEL